SRSGSVKSGASSDASARARTLAATPRYAARSSRSMATGRPAPCACLARSTPSAEATSTARPSSITVNPSSAMTFPPYGAPRGAHVDCADSRHTENRVQILQRLRGLDHRHDDDVVVGAIAVVASGVERRAHGAKAPVAARRILARGDERLGLGARRDHRADDAVDARVEDLHESRRIVPGYPGERDHRRGRDRLEHRDGALVVATTVQHVTGEGVES